MRSRFFRSVSPLFEGGVGIRASGKVWFAAPYKKEKSLAALSFSYLTRRS